MAFLKLFHVLCVFIWIGCLLALTRLMIYQVKESVEVQVRLSSIYKRMYFFIDLPAMVLAIVSGIALFFIKKVDWSGGWLHMKLTFVVFLIACDVVMAFQIQRPIVGKGVGYKVLHGLVLLFLILTLASIYILKQKNGC